MINERRLNLLNDVISKRQTNITVILENVHDTHNIGAVVRTCESIGIYEVILLYTHEHLKNRKIKIGRRTSAGARKWVEVVRFNDAKLCFEYVKTKYDNVLATNLSETAQSIYDIDLTGSIAIMFGNEKEGITPEALSYVDGNILIPQAGMVQSLNISVACSVVLYEAFRQRKTKGLYGVNNPISKVERKRLFDLYLNRHENKHRGYDVEIKS